MVRLEGLALAGDDFGSAEVDVFNYTVMVEQDIWGRSVNSAKFTGVCDWILVGLTFRLDVTMSDSALVEISQTL